ncbi:hypothetical protein EVJ58_g7217 [Rhodofomes roseus]|uniref:Uncharacterized protein n=1 Tax=Rhodofomes roseus TaxID=34475 RepID=A0A4Y9Y5E0_9APHY|nr:hypothetical protein EVJ58_g7217 [Rhodofomes roseus]
MSSATLWPRAHGSEDPAHSLPLCMNPVTLRELAAYLADAG